MKKISLSDLRPYAVMASPLLVILAGEQFAGRLAVVWDLPFELLGFALLAAVGSGLCTIALLAVSMIASGARFDDSQAMDKAMDGNNVLFHGYAVFALVAMVYYVMGAGEDSRTRALYACLKDRQAIERARPSTMMRTCLEEDLGVSIDLTSR